MVKPFTSKGISTTPPEARPITQRKFDKGVISIVGPSDLPLNALVKADNIVLEEDGKPRPRPGNDWYGTELPTNRGDNITTFTNLVTNPNFETDTTGWNAAGTGTVTNDAVVFYEGLKSLKIVSSGGNSPILTHGISGLTVGVQYELFVVARLLAGGIVTIGKTDSGSGFDASQATTLTAATWTQLHFSFVATATSTTIRITGPVNATLNIDAVAVGFALDGYFDGNVTDTLAAEYIWTGTANASTSTKTTYDVASSVIDGGTFYVTDDQAIHLIVVAGGIVYRSLNDGLTWEECSGGRFTPGHKVHDEQTASVLYLFNGFDNIIRYTGSTTLVVYDEINQPGGPTVAKTGLAGTEFKYYYRLAYVNDVGYTMGSTFLDVSSTESSIEVDRPRSNWDDSNYVTLTWVHGLQDTNADGVVDTLDLSAQLTHFGDGTYAYPSRVDLYIGEAQGEEVYFDSVDVSGLSELATVTYIDKNQAPMQNLLLVPEDNTTVGPKIGDMALVGTRLYATQDYDNPWRVWISGAGRDIGRFSSAFEGTYIDLQKGSQFRPMKVEDYRDGKGTPLATVWCNSTDGRGCIWQGTLDTFTVGDVSFPVPNFYRLPGSRGTNAPDSVVNVLNDYMYYNSQAVYNLGSRAQFLNLLSTDESSANIRPDVRSIRSTASGNIAGYYFEAYVYLSVPYNADANNRTIVFDTERKAWLPNAFDIGFERFFQYTDTAGAHHLLCWKPGDSRLTHISRSIKGSYGEAIPTYLLTGMVFVNFKNRFNFFWTEEGEFELSNVAGTVEIELAGITREDGFKTIDTVTISPSTTPVGWTRKRWTTHAWTDGSSTEITNYSEPTIKRYFNVQQDVNAYQYAITTNDIDADYLLRTLQVNGTDTVAGKPREWEILNA